MADDNTEISPIELAAELTIAWLSNPYTKAEASEVATALRQMRDAVKALSDPADSEVAPRQEFTPAVTVRKSLASKDHIISLIDGKPYKTLRRHLSGHGLTPDDYRARYGLKSDYPMVSASYSQVRRDMAKKIGLGRKPTVAAIPAAPAKLAKAATPAAEAAKPSIAVAKPAVPATKRNKVAKTPAAPATKPSKVAAASAAPAAAKSAKTTTRPAASAAKSARGGRPKKSA